MEIITAAAAAVVIQYILNHSKVFALIFFAGLVFAALVAFIPTITSLTTTAATAAAAALAALVALVVVVVVF